MVSDQVSQRYGSSGCGYPYGIVMKWLKQIHESYETELTIHPVTYPETMLIININK